MPGDPVRAEERAAFADKAGLPADHFVTHDLLAGAPRFGDLRQYDALMIGGSGDYHLSAGDIPNLDALLDVLRRVVDAGHPMFASCFGFQALVVALGGDVVFDEENIEVGTMELTLTDAGMNDPLFGKLPRRFMAQVGRRDRARTLPAGLVHLASSRRCPFHALRVPDKPIWATQFHPELNGRENRRRFERYRAGYASHMSPAEFSQALRGFTDSPETGRLIPAFLEMVRARRRDGW